MTNRRLVITASTNIKHGIYLALFICSFFSSAQAQNYQKIGVPVTEIFTQDQHQGTGQNWWLVQGNNGLIYSGTGTGITEWDGERWRMYPTPNKTLIRSASKWKDGRIYVGTTNDIGYYHHNERGILTYYSLLDHWTFEQRQFGQVWSIASNQHGVIFVTRKVVLFWNGKQVNIVEKATPGQHRIFALEDSFIYKVKGDPVVQKISKTFDVTSTKLLLPEKSSVYFMAKNRNNNLVAFTFRDGIFEQQDQQMVMRIDNPSLGDRVRVYNGIQASDGYYYVATLHNGLLILSEDFKLVRQYTEQHNIGGNKIYSLLEDRQNNIWLSGVPNIIKIIPPHIYSRYQTEKKITLINTLELFQSKITIAADGFHQLQLGPSPQSPAFIKKLDYVDGSRWDFLEYKNHFIYVGEGGVFARKFIDGNFTSESEKLGTSIVGNALAIDPITNKLFAATQDGIIIITFEQGTWQTKSVEELSDELKYLAIDNNGVAWAGTETHELYRIENAQFPDKETKIQKFTDGLGSSDVQPFNLSTGVVIGTSDGLVEFRSKGKIIPSLQPVLGYPKIFTDKGKAVNRLYEDDNQRLWYRIGDHAGYAKKDSHRIWQSNEELFKAFPNNGHRGFVTTAADVLWFISSKGKVYRLNLDQMKIPPKKGLLNIREILNLNTNKMISGGLINTAIPQLDQQNNSVRIVYALAENANANPAQYRHKLLGSDNESWSPWTLETHKDYTHLPGSEYQFSLEAKDGWGRVSQANLSFSVLPPWYLSKFAWFAYTTTFLLLLILTGWLTQRWRTAKLQKANKDLERKITERTKDVQSKAQQLKEQQILKDRFFSNVSHEFRTPLTLIRMPLQDLLRSHPELEPAITHPIESALRNSQRMLELVSQVLDINRLESGQFPLNVAEHDIANLINLIINRFKPWSEQHQQVLIAQNTNEPILIYCDQDQIEKCISNLVSNAIKYSGEKSQINISLVENTELNSIGIQVKDNGGGISKNSEDKIFDRFCQDTRSEGISDPGTGIGLSLVKELVNLHHGKVELINEPGESCCFIIWLPRGYEHFSESSLEKPGLFQSEIANSNLGNFMDSSNLDNSESAKTSQVTSLTTDSIIFPEKLHDNIADESGEKENHTDKTTILIVDDNHELRHFVALRLSSYYRIIQASNGQEGLAMASTELPDLVISDVMMPIKNGLDMVKELKANSETNFIPVILLTAKSTKRETVEGLETGADDYLTKPFDTSELIVRIAGLMENRKKLRKRIEAELTNSQLQTQSNSNSQNTSFKDRLRTEIQTQITKPEFSIDNIAKSLALSRRSLNRKCQQELQQSIGNFITEIKMQSALQLLKQKNHNVSEVAYATGYESLAYFSRTFKGFFGKPPSSVSQINKS